MAKLVQYIDYKEQKIPILTIPKGTIMFRSTKKEWPAVRDFLGTQLSETSDTYCLSSHQNVFFYPYPYVMDTNPYAQKEKYDTYILYEIMEDTKVVLMVLPSKYGRKKIPSFVKECSEIPMCQGTGIDSDICLAEDFVKENRNIAGIYSIQYIDSLRYMKGYVTDEYEPFRKYQTMLWDKEFNGIPELTLHPLRLRNLRDITTKINVDSEFEYIKKRKSMYNFFPFLAVSHNFFEYQDEMCDSLTMLLSPKGMKEEENTYHLTIDKRTYFYCLYEKMDGKNRKFCVPIQEKNKLSILRRKNPLLIFSVLDPDKNSIIKKLIEKKNKKNIP